MAHFGGRHHHNCLHGAPVALILSPSPSLLMSLFFLVAALAVVVVVVVVVVVRIDDRIDGNGIVTGFYWVSLSVWQ